MNSGGPSIESIGPVAIPPPDMPPPPPGDLGKAGGVSRWINEGGAGGEAASEPLRILVVEDDAIIGMLLGELLTAMGHKVCAVVGTEAEAVAAAVKHHPDLMMVDATLGEGNGIRAVETILRAGPVAHLFTTGEALGVSLRRPGAVVVQKPFDEADLIPAIARALAAD
jgi:CheY-like chemotaxis protein